MQIAVCMAALLFGTLSIVAAGAQIKKEGPLPRALLMSGGACVLTAGALFCRLGWAFDWPAALIGCGMICTAAILNGKKSGKLHPLHHIIRIGVSVLLMVGFVLW